MIGPDAVSSDIRETAALVRRRTGLSFTGGRLQSFSAGVAAAMRNAGVHEAADYRARLGVEPALLDDLVARITVGETYFFREPQQVELIRNTILAEWAARPPRRRALRIWSAGCATGEEPYTLAILAREMGLGPITHIVGTDLSRTALARARNATYTKWSLRGVPDRVTQTYFTRTRDQFVLDPSVRDAVDFRYLNLAEDTYPSLAAGVWGMDLIVCRNVLIYFDPDTTARVAQRLIDSLGEGGWLLLGASDPMLSELVPCGVTVTQAGLAYRRSADDPPSTRIAWPAPSWMPPARAPAGERSAPVPRDEHMPSNGVSSEDESIGAPSVAPPESDAAAPESEWAEVARWYVARDYARTAARAAELVAASPQEVSGWILLVRSLANMGDLAAAAASCVAAQDRHGMSAELAYLHAVLLTEAGQPEAAAAAARRALYLDRGFVVAHLALGDALARLDDVNGARRALLNGERLLAAMAPDDIVPASDGEPSGRLVEMTRIRLRLLPGAAA